MGIFELGVCEKRTNDQAKERRSREIVEQALPLAGYASPTRTTLGRRKRPPYRSQGVTTKYLATLGMPLLKTVAKAGP